VGFAIRWAYGILLPEMLTSLGISKLEAGVIYTSHFLGYTLASPILGTLIDKYDAKKVIAISLVILCTGTFLLSLSSTVFEAATSYMIAGIGCAACWVPVVVVIQRLFEGRALPIGIAATGAHISFAFCGAIMPLLIRIGGWRLGWQFLSFASLMLAPTAWLVLRSYPRDRSQKSSLNKKGGATSSVLKDVRLWTLAISYMFVGFYVAILTAFLGLYCIQELSLSYEIASSIVGMITYGAVPGALVLGWFSEKFGRVRSLIMSETLSMVGFLGIILAGNISGLELTLLYFSVIIYGLGFGAIGTLFATYVSDIFPAEHIGVVQGLTILFFGIGCMVSPPLAGWIADIAMTFKQSFTIAITTALLSIAFLLLSKR
jgi:MFS family permease